MVFVMNIGESVRLIRQVAQLTQEEMAARLQITSNYLSLLENGKATPRLSLLKRIEACFDVPASFIVWNAHFAGQKSDPEISERYRRLGEQMTELAITLVRRRQLAEGP
jgi:transcriptional regulator with XRE-family HTH domain